MKKLKYLLIYLIIPQSYAQVPRQERSDDLKTVNSDKETYTREQKNKDEIYSISYESNGKKSFLMGDQSKKGLYDEIINVHDKKSYIVIKDNRYGITNNKGEHILKTTYDSIGNAYNSDGFVVKQNGFYGKISNTGSSILAIKYNKIIAGNQYVTLVKNHKNEHELIIVDEKKSINNIDYVELYKNIAIVKSNGKYGVVKNNIAIPFQYDSIYLPTNDPNRIPTISKYNTHQKKSSSNPLIRNYQSVTYLTLQLNDKVGLATSEGDMIFPVNNDAVYNAELFDYYSVKKAGLYGIYFSKSKDKIRTEIEFDNINVDGYGAIMASKNNKMGIFNLNGKQITPFEFDNDFISQYLGVGYKVSKNKKKGIIDYEGKVILPIIYDNVSINSIDERNTFKVEISSKYGIVHRNGEVIIPIEFENIFDLNGNYLVINSQEKFGLFDKKGTNLLPVSYQAIFKTATPDSNILVVTEDLKSYNFFNSNHQFILPQNASTYGYVLDENNLNSPTNRKGILYVKDANGKFGLIDEMLGTLVAPLVYDDIIQCTNGTNNNSYFAVRKGKKYGLINSKNESILPIKYDAIDLTFGKPIEPFSSLSASENNVPHLQIVVANGKKFGAVDLKGNEIIPFLYSQLKKISPNGLYKAKIGKKYQILKENGQRISEEKFDEIANFEYVKDESKDDYILQALTFSNGKMRVIDQQGNFIGEEQNIQPHNGYETFDQLKSALIEALDSKNDVLLKDFVNKIAPSEHILYYLKTNLFNSNSLTVDIASVKEKYLNDLLEYKYNNWNTDTNNYSSNNRSSLTTEDYTEYSERYGIITNFRTSDHAYGDIHFMEKLLRDSIKINGYWISSYFMTRAFYN